MATATAPTPVLYEGEIYVDVNVWINYQNLLLAASNALSEAMILARAMGLPTDCLHDVELGLWDVQTCQDELS